MAKLKEGIQYTSEHTPKSRILKNTFFGRLSSLFGFRPVSRDKAQTDFEKTTGIRFVKVDVDNTAYRVKQAALGSVYRSNALSTTLRKYFDAYLNETTQSYSDTQERQRRLNEIDFAVKNDPFLSSVCRLVADEATQLDDQNRIIGVESSSVAFVNRCYELFAQWGITQTRTRKTCYDIQEFGEGLWAHRITERGVERIIPLDVRILRERLEFNAQRMAKYLADTQGHYNITNNRQMEMNNLIDMLLKKQDTAQDVNENFADLFDSKLLGFEFDDDMIAPPWVITHFRYDAESTEFFPYGTPPLLMAIAPFQQLHSTMALQGLARQMSFPVQCYKVKQTEGVGAATSFQLTNNVREEYDNIGVTPQSNSLEVYTINTKVWIPDGLLDLQILKSDVDFDFTGDLELYQDRVAIACGVPKAYLDQEFGGFGNSGIALIEQYKPFARHVYTIQSAYLEGLGQLIRLHFAITGEFDYNTPFVLSMRFPAEEMGDERREARAASVELASGIVELLQKVLGIEEDEPLPEDVVTDILSKYTFLDPTDLQRWIRLSAINKAASATADEDSTEGADEGGGIDGDMGGDFGGEEGDADVAADEAGGTEMAEYYRNTKKRLREKKRRLREKIIRKRYKEAKGEVLMHFLESNGFSEWKDPQRGHALLVPKIDPNGPLHEYFQVVKKGKGQKKLTEQTMSIKEFMNQYQLNNKDIAVINRDSAITEAVSNMH